MLCDEGSWKVQLDTRTHTHTPPNRESKRKTLYLLAGWLVGGEKYRSGISFSVLSSKSGLANSFWSLRTSGASSETGRGDRTSGSDWWWTEWKKRSLFLSCRRENPLVHSLSLSLCARRWKIALDCVSCTVLFPRLLILSRLYQPPTAQSLSLTGIVCWTELSQPLSPAALKREKGWNDWTSSDVQSCEEKDNFVSDCVQNRNHLSSELKFKKTFLSCVRRLFKHASTVCAFHLFIIKANSRKLCRTHTATTRLMTRTIFCVCLDLSSSCSDERGWHSLNKRDFSVYLYIYITYRVQHLFI